MNSKNTGHYPGTHRRRAGVPVLFEEIKIGFMAVPVVPYIEPIGEPRFSHD